MRTLASKIIHFFGSDTRCDLLNTYSSTQEAVNFFKLLKGANLHFEISLILGYPQETDEDFKETLDFIAKNKAIIPKIAQVNPFIDYLKDFKNTEFPSPVAMERMAKLVKFIEEKRIRYTKSFIGNLIYTQNQVC